MRCGPHLPFAKYASNRVGVPFLAFFARKPALSEAELWGSSPTTFPSTFMFLFSEPECGNPSVVTKVLKQSFARQ
jgi:hypothetical protein